MKVRAKMVSCCRCCYGCCFRDMSGLMSPVNMEKWCAITLCFILWVFQVRLSGVTASACQRRLNKPASFKQAFSVNTRLNIVKSRQHVNYQVIFVPCIKILSHNWEFSLTFSAHACPLCSPTSYFDSGSVDKKASLFSGAKGSLPFRSVTFSL